MMKVEDFKVKRSEHGAGVLDWVAARLGISRKKAKAWLDARAVQVNGRPVWMARHRLTVGDVVRVMRADRAEARTAATVNILFEDADGLVVDKPPGILSNARDSVESQLRRIRGEPAICAVHRLDRDTSGCLIYARHAEARDALIGAFRADKVVKIYHALTWGRMKEAEMTLTSVIDGQRAVTRVRLLDASPVATHWQVRIETGRTHQIRKHLSRQGCPIVGDRQYRGSVSGMAFEAPRHMLHAASVTFPHPRTSRLVRVEAPLPKDFCQAMRRLGLK